MTRYSEPKLLRALAFLGSIEMTEDDYLHLAVLCVDQGMISYHTSREIARRLGCEPFEKIS